MNTILDTRDLAARLEELRDLKSTLESAREERVDLGNSPASTSDELDAADDAVRDAEAEFGEAEQTELDELETLESEVSEWSDGNIMIPESEFVEYAQQLAEDLGYTDVGATSRWPYTHIDWNSAADELRVDYSEVEYQGTTYLVRA